MRKEYLEEAPDIVREFLLYVQNIQGKGEKTVDEYYRDLRTFFRYMLYLKKRLPKDCEIEKADISDIDLDFVKSVSFNDVLMFFDYCMRDRKNEAAARARKVTALRRYFKYLKEKQHKIDNDPTEGLDFPKKPKQQPKYLTLEQSIELVRAVDGEFEIRDRCILLILLNCGLRVSEVAGINTGDIRGDKLTVTGKGNKQRTVYINDACIAAIEAYMNVRPIEGVTDKRAFFVSRQNNRMSTRAIQKMVYKYLEKIGLGGQGYSVHKLRHTAATLMYQHGDVDIRVLKDILGHENLGTTEIYTHLSDEQVKAAIDSNPLAKIFKKQ